MGKRNRKSKSAGGADSEGGMPRLQRKDVMDIVNTLLEKCSNPFGGKKEDWDEFVQVYGLVEKLRKKQAQYVMSHPERDTGFPAFLAWLNEHGVKTNAVEIDKFDLGGYGLKATEDIQMSDMFLSVPHKLMMTTNTAKASALGEMIKSDKILQTMPNVSVALHLLCEKATPGSFWTPYINILPHSYDTILYFTPDEIKLLKGSPAYAEAISQYRNITRQYAYFYKMFQTSEECQKLPMRNMCFDDYRWAVSTVMTRQNQIPNRKGEQTVISLIPLWDMCNHDNGHITTDYDLKSDCSQCYALRNFQKGEQIFIFYGERGNADFLIHNGFIFPNNHYDKLNIKLGISKNDHLFAMKSEVLARLSLLPSRVFGLHAGQDPVDSNTLAYLRVFNMNMGELSNCLRGPNATKLVHELKDFGLVVNVGNEKKCWNFLETRVQLLLRGYQGNIQGDEQLLSKREDGLSHHARMALELCLAEKRILENTARFCRLQREEIDMLVQQHLQEMSMGMEDLDTEREQRSIQDGFNRVTVQPIPDIVNGTDASGTKMMDKDIGQEQTVQPVQEQNVQPVQEQTVQPTQEQTVQPVEEQTEQSKQNQCAVLKNQIPQDSNNAATIEQEVKNSVEQEQNVQSATQEQNVQSATQEQNVQSATQEQNVQSAPLEQTSDTTINKANVDDISVSEPQDTEGLSVSEPQNTEGLSAKQSYIVDVIKDTLELSEID